VRDSSSIADILLADRKASYKRSISISHIERRCRWPEDHDDKSKIRRLSESETLQQGTVELSGLVG
jgi:hypothetical protein